MSPLDAVHPTHSAFVSPAMSPALQAVTEAPSLPPLEALSTVSVVPTVVVAELPLAEAAPVRGGCCGCCKRRCSSLKQRPKCLWGLAIGVPLWALACVAGYLWVPQMMINSRLDQAQVQISECIVQIGPNASASIAPAGHFSVSKDILAVPLLGFQAAVHGMKATVFFQHKSSTSWPRNSIQTLKVGIFSTNDTINVDSSQDLDLEVHGEMELDDIDAVGTMVNDFLKEETLTLSMQTKVDIHGHVWGWLPFSLYGVEMTKAVTVPAFNNFKSKTPALAEIVSAHGAPGSMNLTATAEVFNPSPLTVILKDSFQMNVYYTWNGARYGMGHLNVDAPMVLKPQSNFPVGAMTIVQTSENLPAMEAFISEYIGPQKGIQPAGAGGAPLLVSLGDGSSASPLLQQIASGLSVDLNFRPKPLYFLGGITGDVVAFDSIVPPFYKVIVHMQVRNPLPQLVSAKKVRLSAHHLSLEGPLLYEYDRLIEEPDFDPKRYMLPSLGTATMDFELHVMREVFWSFLFSPAEIAQLISEGVSQRVTVGVDLHVTLEIADGYTQEVHYLNEAITGEICFHATETKELCGGLPPMPPAMMLVRSGNTTEWPAGHHEMAASGNLKELELLV